eukprot:568912-Amphidinium_carterae.1
MTEDQVRMFLKDKDPVVLIEDETEDEAAYRAAAASTSDSDDPEAAPACQEASSSEESSHSEESPDVPDVSELMDTSTTTVVTTSDESEPSFYDCIAQPAHTLPTHKKTKPKAKQKAAKKHVRFDADVVQPHANETREE